MTRHLCVAVGCVVLTSNLWAQTPTPSPSPSPAASPALAAELPKPAPELQKLQFLVGDWVHSEHYPPGPMGAGGTGGARSKTTWILGDHHLFVSYVSKNPMGQVEARGFFGWDPDRRAYRLHWFDNMGMARVYHGDFDGSGVLVLTGEHTVQGRPVREQLSYKRQEDGKVLVSGQTLSADGPPVTVFESLASPDPKK